MRTLAALLAAAALMGTSPPVKETFVEAPGPNGPLKGTMLSPSNAATPIVLMIPGSGPTDRDGNNPLGVKAASLRLIAEGLAAQGIASVRIDKRGLFASAAAVPDANAVTMEDYATDVHNWVSSIRARTGGKCVWLLGHSEGGLVALTASRKTAASHAPEGICGLILIATPGRPFGAVLRGQLHANPANAPLLDQADRAITELEAGRRVDASGLNPALAPLFRANVQGFLISAMALDPAKLVATYRGPVLILQGERDIQVSKEDAALLGQAQPKAQLRLLPDTNHVLKVVTSDDRAANLATYANPDLPLVPDVVPDIATFIRASR
ncbi:alpha/beta hydrolase [Sphingomonas sp. IC081]|uniref:alpha/beta hydrolase n=1 Tax=Sphingomonas sp. IC081 TaxID=304378 RepID=UPI00115AE220|nr:alpha/beta fold hydrolase [Sphingomonas sp. IC081]QDK31345.1 alpha/beta hydrolase [Sphingomonas sp. IC081]